MLGQLFQFICFSLIKKKLIYPSIIIKATKRDILVAKIFHKNVLSLKTATLISSYFFATYIAKFLYLNIFFSPFLCRKVIPRCCPNFKNINFRQKFIFILIIYLNLIDRIEFIYMTKNIRIIEALFEMIKKYKKCE